MRHRFVFILFSIIIGWSFVGAQDLTILQFSDVHEITAVDDGQAGGFARAVTVRDRVAAEAPNEVLILFSGDMVAPSLMSGFFYGAQIVDLSNHLGIDYAVVGNHEFDFGPDVAAERFAESEFEWLLANITRADGTLFPGTSTYALVEWDGTKVGLIGLANDWRDLTSTGDSQYLDYVPVARELVADLQAQGAEVIIALTHAFMDDDRRLAREVDGIDLILGGHDHMITSEVVNGTTIIKSGSDLRHLGHVRVFKMNNTKAISWVNWIPLDAGVPEDADTLALVNAYEESLSGALDQVIGSTRVVFDTNRSQVRAVETPIGNLIADAQRLVTGADVALTNGGNIRGDRTWDPGDLTGRDILTILPFNNIVVNVKVTGEVLLSALENSVSQLEHNAGRFAQVSGVSFVVERDKPAGSRVSEVMVGGEPLDLAREYVVSINDYLAEGGDGYTMFADAERVIDEAAGPLLAELVTSYIRDNSPVDPQVEGRITIR